MFRTELLENVEQFLERHTIRDKELGIEYYDFKNIHQALLEFGNEILDKIDLESAEVGND